MGENKRPTIAVITGNTNSEYCYNLMDGFRTCAKEEDVNLVFLMAPHIPLSCKKILAGSFAWDNEYQFHVAYDYVHYIKPDAIIIAYGSLSHFKSVPNVEEFVARYSHIPCLLMGDYVDDPEVACLTGGNYSGMRECVRHLMEDHGYRKIAYLGGPKRNFDSNQRLRAYRDVLTEHGIAVEENMIAYGNYTDLVDKEVDFLLDNNPGLDAIVFANDDMAKGGYRVCTERGLVVGRDIAITGFDNTDIAKTMEPPLTSVAHSSYLFSYRAIQMALELCKGNKQENEEMQAFFRKRESCGCKNERIGKKTEEVKDIQEFLKKRIQDIIEELFTVTPYEDARAGYKAIMESFVFEVYRIVFEAGRTVVPADDFSRFLKKMCADRLVSERLLLEYLEGIIYDLMECVETETQKEKLFKLLRSMQQYVHAEEVNNLNKDVIRSEQKLWFTPTFIGDLINTKLGMSEQMEHIMNRLQAMEVRSAYLFFFKDSIVQKSGEVLNSRESMYLTAYYNEKEQVCYQAKDMVEVKYKEGGFLDVLPEGGGHYYTAFPIFSGEEQFGMMMCEVEQEEYPFVLMCSLELGTLRRIINMNIKERMMQRELEEKNRILSVISSYDDLSKLLNRRGFMEKAIKLIRENKGNQAWLIFADVDHLKEINDTFGHAAGDYAITTAADYLRRGLPSDAVIARIGGDEYVALVSAKAECGCDILKNNIKRIITDSNLASDKAYYVEMSVGIHEFVCEPDTDIADLLSKSDAILYEEKKNRRKSVRKEN